MPQSHTKTRTPSQLNVLLERVAALVIEERIPAH